MEVKPGFLALCPFCPPQPFAGVGVHPQGDAGSSETGLGSLPPSPLPGPLGLSQELDPGKVSKC